jgi:O-acetyl-ADP-ribose deacetylase (regulator of RNase III)
VKEKRIGPATVRLLQGDITTCEVDAVINVTGKTLVPHDDDDSTQAVKIDPTLWDGSDDDHPVVMKPGQELKAQHILLAPIVETTSTSGAHKIRKTMRRILEEAQENGLKTLALPAIGAGINRYPIERCAEILFEELARSVLREGNTIEKVVFVLDTQKSYRIFEQVLNDFKQDLHARD